MKMKRIISAVLAVIVICSFAVCAQARTLGDVDCDGQVNSVDALMILKYAVGMIYDSNIKYADVDLNGTVNSNDALIVLRFAAGMYEKIENADEPACMDSILAPIIATGNYTIKMGSAFYNSDTIVITGDNAAEIADTRWYKEIAMYKDGKNYYVLPEHKIYAEVPITDNIAENIKKYFTNLTFTGTMLGTVKQKTYRCEVFRNSSENICKFYFDGDRLEYLTITDSTGTSSLLAAQIMSFSGEIDENIFSFSGYEKTDIDEFEEFLSGLIG